LRAAKFTILAINPGSASTKIGVFENGQPLLVKNIRHGEAELKLFRDRPVLDQQNFWQRQILATLSEAGFQISRMDAVVGRGGLLPPLQSGTYLVGPEMLAELRRAPRGEHASNLGAWLAHSIAHQAGLLAYIVDPVSVDEWPQIARLSGSALLERQSLSHALNSKAVAKRFAAESGSAYESLSLVVAHLGSGISISAHRNGRMLDVTNSREEGAFSTERAGSVPIMQLVDLCFAGTHTRSQIEALLFREGGLYSYLRTKDLEEVERRIAAGDTLAGTVFEAMVYQIAKEIGAMAAVLCGDVDGVLLTGGMAHSELVVSKLREYVSWIAPITIYPGEDELQALADGVLRVLRGEEPVREFRSPSLQAVTASAG
jgi:butyrate kinase